MAAFSLTQSRSALGAFYRRLRSRLGAPKAITATAHKLARLFYQMWATAGQYSDPGMDYYEQKYNEQVLKNLTEISPCSRSITCANFSRYAKYSILSNPYYISFTQSVSSERANI
ncbi:hypothetical protein [Fischerella sp. PCC 9605]|uniref:hypothetical protein n=1 Tax=Fischerella sp. PCC 9605 TaxID=1173024 RepID=UPI0004AD0062